MTFDNLIDNVTQWADDKNILKPENAPKQPMKVMEELGETAGAIAKNKNTDPSFDFLTPSLPLLTAPLDCAKALIEPFVELVVADP